MFSFKKYMKLIGLILVCAGLALIAWCIVGQMIAQFNYDGRHISWRTIYDPSLFGAVGIVPFGIGMFLILREQK